MRTTNIMCRKGKRGISTVLGTLIFVGILFSAVIPMFLVMKQADTIYEQKILEMRRRDDEHDIEALDMYAYPAGPGSSDLEIEIDNNCALLVTTARVWINDTYVDRVETIQSMSEKRFGSFPVPIQEGSNSSYIVRVTTDRGNTFDSLSGPIYYNGSDWVAEVLGIFVQISGGGFWGFGKYNVTVTNITDTNVPYSEHQETTFQSGTTSVFFDVSEAGAGTYNVYVEKWSGFWWWGGGWTYMDDKDVELLWPSGPAIEWVYFG